MSRGADGLALPVLAGLVLALAFPPAELLIPAFVGLAPLLVFIAERPPGPAGRWAATRAGLLTGLVYFGIQLYWLVVALLQYSLLAIPAYLGSVLVLSGLAGAFAWSVHFTHHRLGLHLALLTAVFWTALEWVQGHLGDLAFPWLGLGTALAPFPALAGAADLVGARGLTLWIAAANGLVATALLRFRSQRPLAPTLAALAVVVVAPAAYGVARAATLEIRPVARVAVIQPAIPEEIKLDRRVAVDSSLTALTRLTAGLEGRPLDLVVWPEVALPADLLRSRRLETAALELSRQVNAPILVGAYGVDHEGDPTVFNSAFLVDTDGGPAFPRYDKRRLVPFVERVPFIDPAILAGTRLDHRYFGGLGRGQARPVFGDDADADFGVLICYESIFAPLARDYRSQGADFLVNITNDAWFGHDRWWGRTSALWQHPAHLVLRAIETRSGVARAANTGFSLFVDPLGRTYGTTQLFVPATSIETVYTTDTTTLFVRWGDWLATGAVLFGVGLLGAGWWRARGRDVGHSGERS